MYIWYKLLPLRWCLGMYMRLNHVVGVSNVCSQDLLMDWSLLRPHARYPLLRPNILYSNNIPVRIVVLGLYQPH